MQTGAYTHTYAQEGCEYMYSGESCTHTFTGRFVHTYVHIKGLPYVFTCKVIFTCPFIQQVTQPHIYI